MGVEVSKIIDSESLKWHIYMDVKETANTITKPQTSVLGGVG